MVRVRVFRLNLVRNSLVCSFKFIKEILGWMSLNLLNFISRFLSKKCFLSAWEILGFARFLVGFCYLALLCRSYKRYEKFFKITHKAPAKKLLIAKQSRIDRTNRVIKQNIHRSPTAKTFNFTAQTLPLHHLPPYQLFWQNFY